MSKIKNVATRAKSITNTSNSRIKFNLILNNLMKILTFILASGTIIALGSKIRNFFSREQANNQLILNEDNLGHSPLSPNQLIPCGSNIEEFIPKSSICYITTKLHVNKECEDVGNVSSSFAQIFGYTYAAGCCKFMNMPIEKCIINMPGIISSIKSAKQIELSKELIGVRLVEQGKYAIVDFKQTVATMGISFCVGVAITNVKPSKVMLAHIGAENIIANDYYLKGRFADPFIAIKNFIATSKLDDWKVTIVGGHLENIVYIKTVLENMGLNNMNSYYKRGWSLSFNNTHNKLNQGSILIQDGQPFIIKNAEDFKHLFVTIPEDQKDKPVALKLQEMPEPATLKLR